MYLDKYKNVIYIVINMFILNYFIVFFVLIYASYTDYTKREIPNWLSFGLILFGLISNFIYSLFIGNFYYFLIVLGLTIATFILFYVFWRLGIFAGGDAKLFTGIASVIPLQTYSVLGTYPETYTFILSILVLTLFVIFPYGAIFALIAIIKKKELLKYLYKELLIKNLQIIESVALVVSLYLVLSFFDLPKLLVLPLSLISGFVPRKIKLPFLVIMFPIAMYLNFYNNLKVILFIVICSYFVWVIFKLFFLTKSGILNYFVKVEDLKEGDLLAHPYLLENGKLMPYNSKFVSELWTALKLRKKELILQIINNRAEAKRKILIDNTLAGGLSKDNILNMNKYIYRGELVELKQTTPLIPAVLMAYIIMIVFGDVIWYLIKLL